MASIRIDTVFNIDLEFEIAAFHKRLLAYLIDLTLLVIYLFCLKYFFYNFIGVSMQENIGLDLLVISLPMLLYSLLTELWMNGQTLGKKLLSIRVISLDGGEPTLGQYILRWITKVFEWPFLFGYVFFSADNVLGTLMATCLFGIAVVIIITVSPKNQRLGDVAAGTVVVDTKTDLSVDDTIFMEVKNKEYIPMFPQVMRLTDNDINTIKNVVSQAKKRNNHDISMKVEYKIKEVLHIQSRLSSVDFLEKLLEDYNYLATKE